MFFRLYKYSLIRSSRDRLTIFWNLIFPVMLGSLFQLAFGNYTEKEVLFHQIPVAYVEEEGADENFSELLQMLETDSELIEVQTVKEEKAKQLLREEQVEGVFLNRGVAGQKDTGISLVVMEAGMNQTILSSILEQYERTCATLTIIGTEYPAGIQEAAALLAEDSPYLKEGSLGKASANSILDYFYSLLAMTCLMGSTTGLMCAVEFKGNLSPLAARRMVAGSNRFRMLWPDLAARITVQFVYLTFSAGYLMFALKVPLGEQWGFLLLTEFVGSMLGIFLGFFIGVAGRMQYNTKEALCILIMMVSSFFSGLMMDGMQRVVERYAPIFARLNPASLIAGAFSSLNIYDTYEKYLESVGTMLVLILILGAGSFMIAGRERYAGI